MSYYNQSQMTPPPYTGGSTITRQMNAVMKRVYLRMFVGLLISAFCALGVASSPAAMSFIFGNAWVYWGMFIGMLAMAWILPSRAMRMSSTAVFLCFALFAALMGCTLASIFYVYRIGSIISTFFITAGVFGAMTIYGYTTKKDLTKFGTFLFMALIGLIVVMIVNIFLKSSGLEWIMSIVGVLIFIGLTAWDTQQIKAIVAANTDPAVADRLATIGALNLYLDFINLFLFLLRIFGGDRD